MSKRKIKDVRTKIPSEVVRTPQPGRDISSRAPQKKYFKPNYLEVLKIITPDMYWDDDISLSGQEVSPLDELINSNMLAAGTPQVISVSGIVGDRSLSSISSIDGLAKYFVKQNNLTWITPNSFQKKFLSKNGSSFSDFDSSGDFLDWVSGTFLPTIPLVHQELTPLGEATNDPYLELLTDFAYADDGPGTHKYLIDNLSWLYFLNTSDPGTDTVYGTQPEGYSTSGELAKLIAGKLWSGDVIDLADCMKIFEKYLWSNYTSFSSIDERFIPTKYSLSTTGEYLSGTQLRDRLETLASIVYAGDYFNDQDITVKEAFDDYLSVGTLLKEENGAGPFTRFMRGLSFSMADRSGEADEIGTLVDIDNCPDEFLPYLADLIGWTLVGPDATRHRNQLRQAVAVYKAKGTKRSIQNMVDTVFGSPSAFNVTSGSLFELWESYIPNLMFYSLITSSILTEKGTDSFPQQMAKDLGLDTYSPDLDTLCRIAVDRMMWELVNEFPNNFLFGKGPFPRPKFYLSTDPEREWAGVWFLHSDGNYYTGGEFDIGTSIKLVIKFDPNFMFFYRGREMPIPPWEEVKYYKNSTTSPALIESIKNKLSCFGVDETYLDSLMAYIRTYTIGFEEERPAGMSEGSLKPFTEDIDFYTNSLLFFTPAEKSAPNYNNIIRSLRPIGNDLIKYLPLWSGKSSHFKIILGASSFDFTSDNLDSSSRYALANVGSLVNAVAPAHAIADIALHVSSVEDANINFSAVECIEVGMGLSSHPSAGGSAAIIEGFSVSTLNPRTVLTGGNYSTWPGGKVFNRNQTTSLSDALFGSGETQTTDFFSGAPRNLLRRRSYKDILDGDTIDLRDGIGAAGYNFSYRTTQLPTFYSSIGDGWDGAGARLLTSGIFSLGFVPSTLSFSPVALKADPAGFGFLIDRENLDPVWRSCQAYNASDQFYGIDVSNTFPFRGLSSVDSGTCSGFFGDRESLTPLLALQHRVKYEAKKHEASSLVSGYFDPSGMVNDGWGVSSSKLSPPTFSSWYEDSSKNVILSIANQLEEATSGATDINYFRDFAYGRDLQKFFRDWMSFYSRQELNFNYSYNYAPPSLALGTAGRFPDFTPIADNNPHIFSHTYGPYFFNDTFALQACSVVSNPQLAVSSLSQGSNFVDISYGFGQGPLSVNNSFDLTVEEVPVTASDSMYVQWPEIRSDTFLSGLELVDSSSNIGSLQPGEVITEEPPPNATFALINLVKTNKNFIETPQTPFWAKSRTLEDNLLIQHSKPPYDTFPRLRYKLEPDATRKDLENFLIPESNYKLSIKAGNFNRAGTGIGGDTLGVWIHTEPLLYKTRQADGNYLTEKSVWSFVAGSWRRTPLTTIIGSQGINVVRSLSLRSTFPDRSRSDILRMAPASQGSDQYTLNSNVITPFNNLSPRIACVEATSGADTLEMVSDLIFDTLTFEFNTLNRNVLQRPKGPGLLHLKERKYYIEIFVMDTTSEKITLFDSIKMENLSFQDKASIPTGYAKYYLNRYELKAVFDHFRDLSNLDITTRVGPLSEDVLYASGGGRMNYRQNVGGANGYNIAGRSPAYNQLSSVIIV